MQRLRPDISGPNIPRVPKISGDRKEPLVPSALQRHDIEDKSYVRPGFQSLSCSRCPTQSRGRGGALREQAKRRENTAKTSLSNPTRECPENLRLKVGGSGRAGCRKALLPGEEDTENVLEGDVVMKD